MIYALLHNLKGELELNTYILSLREKWIFQNWNSSWFLFLNYEMKSSIYSYNLSVYIAVANINAKDIQDISNTL